VYLTPVGNDISSVNFGYPLNLYEATFSSRFGWRSWGGTEYFPKFNNHRGMDLRAESETAILSICDVLPNEFQSSYDPYEMGYHVIVTDNESGRTITYMHMFEPFGTTGVTPVVKGGTIGKVGNTGNSEGAHLHIQIYDRGTWMYHDPSLYFPDYVN
jgi:murein DD-endopeptidase MepM/ murein hydrolase activator NlpD